MRSPRPLVAAGEVVHVAFEHGVAGAGLLGAVAPVVDVVAVPMGAKGPMMIAIGFAGVAGHGFGHAEGVGPAGAEEGVPEEHVGHKLGVGPGPAADIVAPVMAAGVVVVHHVAEVPEAVPFALVDLVAIVREELIELILDPVEGGGGAVGEAPEAEGLLRMEICGGADEDGGLGGGMGHVDEGSWSEGISGKAQRVMSVVWAMPVAVPQPGFQSS